MAFYDYRQPIEYVVDQYFHRKRFYGSNSTAGGMSMRRGEYQDHSLPEIPCHVVRDDNGRAYKFIYGEVEMLTSGLEGDPVIWQEELTRDANGKVIEIETTYPNGGSFKTAIIRDTDNKFEEYKYLL